MNIFANKNIWKKIVIIFILITTISFVAPKPVSATIGGTIGGAIRDLSLAVGDGIVWALHRLILEQDNSLVRIDISFKIWAAIGAGIAAALAIAALVIIAATGVGAVIEAVVGATVVISASTVVAISVAGGIFVGVTVYEKDFWQDDIVILPIYTLTPETIFANQVPMFNVNFFNGNQEAINEGDLDVTKWQYTELLKTSYNLWKSDATGTEGEATRETVSKTIKEKCGYSLDDFTENGKEISGDNWQSQQIINAINNGGGASNIRYFEIYVNNEQTEIYRLEAYDDTPWEQDNRIETRYNYGLYLVQHPNKEPIYPISNDLHDIIAKWYYMLWIIATVGMMSVLVYVGIKILISSTSPQKAKYKQLLGDWLVGMILLFTMHFIMIFANKFVDNITEFLKGSIGTTVQMSKIEYKSGYDDEFKKNGIEFVDTYGEATANNSKVYRTQDKKYFFWTTSMMGQIRMLSSGNLSESESAFGYTVMFTVMVFYTCLFTWTYIKRVVYMAFLTLIAPLVALTYPIDKANDGQAQGFNYWFKEYLFNLLLQPMHLLLYTVLVSSAAELATKNFVYALVALGFIGTGEKIVRQMFNFSKANTPGAFAGPAGAAMAIQGMRWLFGHGPKGGPGGQKPEVEGGNNKKINGPKNYGSPDQIRALMGSDNNNGGERVTKGSGKGERQGTTQGGRTAVGGGTREKESGEESVTARMREAEMDNSVGLPDQEDVTMWNREQMLEGAENNDNQIQPLSGNELVQNLREAGQSDEEIAELLEGEGYSNNDISGLMGTGDELFPNGDQWDNYTYTTSPDENGDYNIPMNNQWKEEPEDAGSLDGSDAIDGEHDVEKPEQQKEYEPTKGEKFRRGFSDVSAYYISGMGQKLKRNVKNVRPIRTLAGAVAGGAMGTIGLAAAIASGDPKNLIQYTAAGVAGGYKIGSNTVDAAGRTVRSLGVEGSLDTYERSALGEKAYKEKKLKEQAKKEAAKEENIRYVQEKMKLSRIEATKKLKEMAPTYMKQNINKVEDWVNIENTMQKARFTQEQAMGAHKISQMVDSEHSYGEKAEQAALDKIAKTLTKGDYTEARRYLEAARTYDNVSNGRPLTTRARTSGSGPIQNARTTTSSTTAQRTTNSNRTTTSRNSRTSSRTTNSNRGAQRSSAGATRPLSRSTSRKPATTKPDSDGPTNPIRTKM